MRRKHILDTLIVLAIIVLVTNQLGAPTVNRAVALDNTLTVRGTTFGWTGTKSDPLGEVEVIAYRENETLGTARSKDSGSFEIRGLKKGPPLVLVLNRTGYIQGKMICVRADVDETVVTPTLLRRTDAKDNWNKLFVELNREFKPQ
jgi:hypothetical protein